MKMIPLLLIATACAPIDAGLGNAVRHNMALHVIDPEPAYAGTPIEAGSGARSGLAFERYREGRTLDPKPAGDAQPFAITGQGAAGAPQQ